MCHFIMWVIQNYYIAAMNMLQLQIKGVSPSPAELPTSYPPHSNIGSDIGSTQLFKKKSKSCYQTFLVRFNSITFPRGKVSNSVDLHDEPSRAEITVLVSEVSLVSCHFLHV